MRIIKNPVIAGFTPDPSIVRVGEDYYIAASTFEWFPGVSIYHSRDLEHWHLISNALDDDKMVDLTGIDSACGIWAPNLTYDEGTFYLIYTIVYTNRSRFKDTHNFLITAKDIRGPWSRPVFLNCSGFDPSLFHDDDGRKWLVNMTIDHRVDNNRFSGIVLQEYDASQKKFTGPIHKIFNGTAIGKTEGPNIIKYNGYYYLTVAEGGTESGHCVTVARSKKLFGEYEVDPKNPMLTSKSDKDYPIQRAGHGQFFQDSEGNWYMAHLCSRPIDGCSILGRETAIQNIDYSDDKWFRLAEDNDSEGRSKLPRESFKTDLPVEESSKSVESCLEDLNGKENYHEQQHIDYQDDFEQREKLEQQQKFNHYDDSNYREDFNDEKVSAEFLTLRKSFAHCNMSLSARKGYLRIKGGNSLSSKFKQSFLARRQRSFSYQCTACMEFKPVTYQHMAGLVCYYNYDNYHYCKISMDEEKGLCISITTLNNGVVIDTPPVPLPEGAFRVYIRALVKREKLKFLYSLDGKNFNELPYELDMSILSDEHVEGNGFTGSMVGVCCQDLLGDGIYADVDWFEYKELDY